MTNTATTTATTSPWLGTNMYVNILLLLASIGGGMTNTTAGLIVAAVTGGIGAFFAIRNWIVTAHFTNGKTWWNDPNNWNYLVAVVVGILPKAGDLMPALKSLIDAMIAGNWGQIISGGVAFLTLAYYTLFKKK